LGFGSPSAASLVAAGIISLLLLLTIPVYALLAGTSFALISKWYLLLPGLAVQAGIAEEVLFRGYLFRHLRAGRSFWKAASLSTLPFAVIHLFLLKNLSVPVASAAIGLAVVISFPLAHLYELGGSTIWAPALLHFVIQGAIKLIVIPSPFNSTFPFVWMAVTAVLPWLALLIRPRVRFEEPCNLPQLSFPRSHEKR
jgi:membrane protease YdiL (CAAX protease family)